MSLERFRVLARRFVLADDVDLLTLESHYCAPNRLYHGVDHVVYTIDILDAIRHEANDVVAIKTALILHDALMDEEACALFAISMLTGKHPQAFCEKVGRLIYPGTKHNGELVDHDEQVIADADLSTLGIDSATFRHHSELLRQEEPDTPEAEYREKKIKFFGGLLKRPHIYYTPAFRLVFEARARENMNRAIERMTL